jgi:hypothetical protein
MAIFDHRPIDVTVPGRRDDPRAAPEHPRRPHPLRAATASRRRDGARRHPDHDPARTLVDLAECMDRDELRATFARAREIGLLDMQAAEASYARASSGVRRCARRRTSSAIDDPWPS